MSDEKIKMAKKKKNPERPLEMFQGGEDSPLFSGVPMRVQVSEFKPKTENQPGLFGSMIKCNVCLDQGEVVVHKGKKPVRCTCGAIPKESTTVVLTENQEVHLVNLDNWLEEVNAIVEKKWGLSVDDLPDVLYADWFEDGVTPKEAAEKWIANAM